MYLLQYYLKGILLLLCSLTDVITCSVQNTRGVKPEKFFRYAIRKNFTCLDGSLSVPFSYVNDDYCDCRDGTDEPGTAACPNGIFSCRNKGYAAMDIPSSFVNDGVCDCCDGSDEYDGKKCPDICEQLGQEARLEGERTKELHRRGNELREKMVALGRTMLKEMNERKAELEKQKEEVDSLIRELEKRKGTIGKRHLTRPIQKPEEFTATKNDEIFFSKDSGMLEKHDTMQPQNEATIEYGEAFEDYKLTIQNNNELNKYELENVSFISKESSDDKIIQVEEQKPLSMTDGRAHYLSALRHKQNINQELLEVKRFVTTDYGLEQEFAPLHGQCFSFTDIQNQYVYEFCPFENVTQSRETGADEIVLGSWAGWDNDNYSDMIYDKGQPCTGGDKRFTKVSVTCGLANKIESLKEPSKCEYSIVYQTPAACKPGSDVLHIHTEL